MIRTETLPVAAAGGESLPALVTRAAQALAGATTSAEILEARELAGLAYDAAKRAARLAKAKGAHDALVAAAHRAQADALLIESHAKRRLADEYDAAQERGEINDRPGPVGSQQKLTTAEVGLSTKDIYEARRIRDAEISNPGIVERALDEALERGDEPTRADIKRALTPSEKMTLRAAEEEAAWNTKQDERQFKSLREAYRKSRVGARSMFREWLATQK